MSTTVLFGLKDPRVKNVTVIRADVSPDLRSAKIYVSVRGDDKTQALSLHGLESARGFIQAKVADRLQTRYTPILHFLLDRGVQISAETSAILRDALAHPAADAPPPGAVPDETPASAAEPVESADQHESHG